MAKLSSLLYAAAVLVPCAGLAQSEERQTPPPGGTPKDFTLPKTDTFALANGLNVTLIPFGAVPKATITVFVRSGNLNEGERTWLADLSGDLLLEGTASRSAEAVAREAAAMGGDIGVNVGEDQTTIGTDVLAEFAPTMIELLADVVRNPAFPASELDRLKRDRLRQLSIAKTRPQQMVTAEFRRALYGDHPYGRLFPDEAQLSAYTIEDARAFYDDNFGARRTEIYVAGVYDDAAMRAAIEAAFADWGAGPEALIDIPMPARSKVKLDIINRPGASQSNVMLGLATINPSNADWIPLQITNTLLGGSFASRITSNIREDKGYTYSPFSGISARYRDAYWFESAAVTTEVTGPAIKEIYGEIDRLQETPPPKSELDGIKNYAAGVFVLQNSTRNGIIGMLNFLDLHELPASYLTEYVSNVYAVTPEKVSEIAATYLREQDMTLAIAGDRGRIAEQVAPYIGDTD
jgi:zinc protease